MKEIQHQNIIDKDKKTKLNINENSNLFQESYMP
jgi:hypothetical protein